MKASIDEVLVASMSTSPALSSTLLSAKALVPVRMMFLASTPAPLTAIPVEPKPAASEAAAAIAAIEAVSSALIRILPVSALTTVLAFFINALTVVSMVFRPRATPMDTEIPVLPKAMAMEAAPARAEMVEVSFAVREMLSALMP